MIDAVLRQAYHQFEFLQADIRLVVVHPNITAQHRFLPIFLQVAQSLYVRLEGIGIRRANLREYVELALRQQVPGILLSQVQCLVVDAWDCVDAHEFEVFVREMLAEMWAGRIVLVGRGLPQWIGNDADLSRQACLMPLASAHLLPDYFHRRMSQALLEVQVFGRGRVLVNGCVIEDWGGELPRALFFYFVDRGLVARDDIFQAFWPQMSIKEATNVFHVTKRKINQVLGLDLMVYGSGFYRIAPQIELIYDAAVFAEAVQNSAVATSQEAEDWLVQAIEVYQRDFLASWRETLPWVEQRRQTLKQTYGEALIALARLYEQKAQPQKALGFYARAFAVFPQREDVAGSLMRLYRDAHMEADVLEVYRKLRDGLAKELNISPARWLQELAGEKSIQSSETR